MYMPVYTVQCKIQAAREVHICTLHTSFTAAFTSAPRRLYATFTEAPLSLQPLFKTFYSLFCVEVFLLQNC